MPSAFRGLPATVWTLFAGILVNRLGYMVTPFLVFFLASRDITGAEVSYVLGALGVGNLLGPALGGLLADRIGRRPTMLAGLTGAAVAQGLLFLAPGVATSAAAAFMLSSTGATVSPAAYALMADAVGTANRQRAYALVGWGINIGTAVAGVLGGYLAAHGYWLLFAVDAGTMLAYAVVVLTRLRESRPVSDGPSSAPAGRGSGDDRDGQDDRNGRSARRGAKDGVGYGVVLRDRLLLAILLPFGVELFVYSLTEAALPLAIKDSGLSAAVYGTMAAVNAVLVVLLQPFATSLLARLPQLPVYTGGSVLVACGVALTGLADGALGFGVSVAVWSLGEVVVSGIAASVVANLAPAHARGRYQGAFQWTWGSARFAALTLGVLVYTRLGPAVLWWAALTAGLTSSVAVLALGTRIDRRVRHVLAA